MSKPIETLLDAVEEFTKCKNSVIYFAETYVYIATTNPVLIKENNSSQVKFLLYKYQKVCLRLFQENRYNVVLKPRQMGITTLMCVYVLWRVLFHYDENILMITIKNTVAKNLMKKIKGMYRSLPTFLQIKVVNGRTSDLGNSSVMEFSNRSTLQVVPNTSDAGRSEALTLVISDETAFQRHASEIWASIQPAIEANGRIIFCSTTYGYNFFQKVWQEAITGVNGINPIKLTWNMHPNRTKEWYDEQKKKIGDTRTAQEIDCEFLKSGNNVFDLELVRECEEILIDLPKKRIQGGKGYQYSSPVRGELYFIGADVSTGRARDYSAYCIMNKAGVIVESFKAKIDITNFGKLLVERAKVWNNAILAPESNSYGEGVISTIQMLKYPNLYVYTSLTKKVNEYEQKAAVVYGWQTTPKNRSVIITKLSDEWDNYNLQLLCPFFLQECYTFIYDNNGKQVALGKSGNDSEDEDAVGGEGTIYTDDSIIATAICNYVRQTYKVVRGGSIIGG